jgi:histidinol phosphatase-like enzyme (inositol monophosphatase family)
MSDFNFADELIIANRMADAARQAIDPFFRSNLTIENKFRTGFDPVTAADRASETAMRAILDACRPDDGIVGEEFGTKPAQNDRQWVLDPIDGTRAFIAGLPSWAVLIALSVAAKPVLGVIDQPHTAERFVGGPDGTVYIRGKTRRQLSTRKSQSLETATMMTTDAELFTRTERGTFNMIRDRVRLCRYGFDAYAYAMLAMGGIDLVIESGLQIYDVQALIPVVEGAGGVITDWRGGACCGGGQVVASAHPDLHAQVLATLESAAA